jgi:hypothetical protein
MAWSEKQKKAVVGGFIVFIMVFSIFGIVMNYTMNDTQQRDYEYYNFTFKTTNEGLSTEIDGKEYTFLILPTDVDFYEVPDQAKQLLKQPMFTVTYDPASYLAEAMAEAQFILEQQLMPEKVIQRALTNNSGTQMLQANCANATKGEPVIEFRESEETLIEVKDNCLILNAVDQYDIIRQEELIRYVILGVIE